MISKFIAAAQLVLHASCHAAHGRPNAPEKLDSMALLVSGLAAPVGPGGPVGSGLISLEMENKRPDPPLAPNDLKTTCNTDADCQGKLNDPDYTTCMAATWEFDEAEGDKEKHHHAKER